MRDKFFAICFIIHRFIERRYAIRRRFLLAQVEIAMSRGEKTSHYILSPKERQWLLSIGAEIDHDVKDILRIVHWKTYRKWVREAKQGIEPGQVGRKKSVTQEMIDLVLRMARENVTWGKVRIVGELKKLKVRISATSVLRILRKAGIEPPPDKRGKPAPVVPWSTFVAGHLDSIVATDFFTTTVWSWRGRFQAYCLFFIHLGSRKVYCSPVTLNPDEQWVMRWPRSAWRSKKNLAGAEEGVDRVRHARPSGRFREPAA